MQDKKRVLLIEDDTSLLEILKTFFTLENFEVLSASDGAEGYTLATQEDLDLIITDFMLPSLNGLEICRKLRDEGIATPIIILTGQVPFKGTSPPAVALKQKTEAPPDLEELKIEFSENLFSLILKCLEKDRTKRFKTANELLKALEKAESTL